MRSSVSPTYIDARSKPDFASGVDLCHEDPDSDLRLENRVLRNSQIKWN